MRTTEQVSVYLGETSEREFKVNVTCDYCSGDYFTPPSTEFYVDSDVYDDKDGVVNELIERYESMFNVDFNNLAIEEFKNLH
tara:strand:- start:3076 stop:3321 length:246 start_codon:yes stop_codon:yes gene_type:complete